MSLSALDVSTLNSSRLRQTATALAALYKVLAADFVRVKQVWQPSKSGHSARKSLLPRLQ